MIVSSVQITKPVRFHRVKLRSTGTIFDTTVYVSPTVVHHLLGCLDVVRDDLFFDKHQKMV